MPSTKNNKPSTCKGTYGFTYEWFTATKSPKLLNELRNRAWDRWVECILLGYKEGELVYESQRGRRYLGWWKTLYEA
jgi:hypothetical protein